MITYDILSITDELIENENIKEVTSSKIFIRPGEPDPEGLASYEIFGYPGTDERKKRYGYINLNSVFVNPHVFFELKSIKKIYYDLVYGNGEFYLKNGDIFRVEDNTDISDNFEKGTGIKFLYKIWDKLNFDYKDLKSGIRYNRLRFLKSLDKKQVFMNKILVIPPYYRDIDVRQGGNKNEVNSIYIKILNLSQTIKTTEDLFKTISNETTDAYRNIMDTLVEFHQKIIKMYGGRKGFIHKYIMGKNIDFSARLVISGLDVTQIEKPEDLNVTFEKCRVPLFAIIKCFSPFIVNGVRDIILDYLKGSEYIIVHTGKNIGVSDNDVKNSSKIKNTPHLKRVKLADDWQTVLTSNYIYNLIELYHESPEHRLDIFTLPTEDGGEVNVGFYIDDGTDIELESDILTAKSKIQPLRLIHLFYMAAYEKVRDKHIYITRYPIEDHNNTYPSGITIIPYKNTAKMKIGDTEYPYFPVVKEDDRKKISGMFTDSLVLFPIYLSALDGDHDGDQLSIIGVFTKEANEDARKHIKSIGNMTAIDGASTRSVTALTQQVIHAFTY